MRDVNAIGPPDLGSSNDFAVKRKSQ